MRLTNETRQQLAGVMMKQMFERREQDLKERRPRAGDEIYRRIVRPFARALARLPEGWVRRGNYFSVVTERGHVFSLELSRVRPLPSDAIPAVTLDVGTRRLLERQQKLELDLRTERSRRDFQVRAILANCHGTEELVERWPEVASLVARYERNSFVTPSRWTETTRRGRTTRTKQPEQAVNLKELSAALGLGKEKTRG